VFKVFIYGTVDRRSSVGPRDDVGDFDASETRLYWQITAVILRFFFRKRIVFGADLYFHFLLT